MTWPALLAKPVGKAYFDKFREQIGTFVSREKKLLNERRETSKASNGAGGGQQASDWVVHTYEVIDQAKEILASAVDMETGMRGYLLAGDDEFLDPYNNGKQQFLEKIASLTETVSDNPAQVKLLSEIKVNVQAWNSDVTEPTIAIRRQIGDSSTMGDMADLVAEARGKVFFDKFREQIATFVERESIRV